MGVPGEEPRRRPAAGLPNRGGRSVSQRQPANEPVSLQFRRLLEAGPVILYQMGIEGGAFVREWVSENVRETLGVDPSQILVPGWWDAHVHPDDLATAYANHKTLFEAGRLTHEYRIRANDGRYLWIRDM